MKDLTASAMQIICVNQFLNMNNSLQEAQDQKRISMRKKSYYKKESRSVRHYTGII